MSEWHAEGKLRHLLRNLVPPVDPEAGRSLLQRRIRRQRIMRIVRWPILFVVLAGLLFWIITYVSGGCAPGAPEFNPSDVVGATLKNMYPEGGGPPVTTSIDLANADERATLLAAYGSMKPANETGRITSPDLYLTLALKGDREIVIVLEKDVPQFLEVRDYHAGKLASTVHLWPGAMFNYMLAKT